MQQVSIMNNPKISLIAAIGKNRELGHNNQLLWKISEDLARFKRLTLGHPIIMGRKTFESIGRVLPGRKNIIISRDPRYTVEGAIVAHSLDEGIQSAKSEGIATVAESSLTMTEGEIFVIGGGQIFEQALPFAKKLYLTVIHASAPADAFFPDYKEFTKVIARETKSHNGITYEFLEVMREV